MIKIEIERFIKDRMWFGWWYAWQSYMMSEHGTWKWKFSCHYWWHGVKRINENFRMNGDVYWTND